jgi:hypothetical protein
MQRSLPRAWRTVLFVFLVVIICVFLVYGSKTFQQYAHDTKHKEADNAFEKGSSNLFIAFGRYEGCAGLYITDNRDAIAAFSTFVVAIFTLTLWRSTADLWTASEKQRVHLEETAERQLRAYVHIIIDQNTVVHFNSGQIIGCRVSVKNSGQTPAHNVHLNGNIVPAEYPLLGDLPTMPDPEEPSRIVIHPNQEFGSSVVADRLITEDEASRTSTDPGFRLFLYGYVVYTDTFGVDRVTTYRLMTPDPTGD